MQKEQSTAAFLSFSKTEGSEVLKQFETNLTSGLNAKQVELFQKQYGKNILKVKEVKWWHVLGRQFVSPFIYLLCGAASLAYILGEPIDAIFIFAFIFINVILGFFQEYRSENILKMLKQYLVAHTTVIREGVETKINKEELAVGDIVILNPGDIVPADMRILECESLEINESVLTGEAESVMKNSDTMKEVKEVYEAKNIAFTGSTVASGRGKALVIAIGKGTIFGGLSALASETVRESSFEKGMKKVSGLILKIVGITFLFVIIIKIIFPTEGTSFFEFLIFSIALAVSVIPEGLPLVITFTLSHGARRLAEKNVVVKRLSSIEDLGSIQVLCTDKTGTITENKMQVASVSGEDKKFTLLLGRLASHPPVNQDTNSINTFDEALYLGVTAAEKKEIGLYEKIHELPFEPIRRRNMVCVESKGKTQMILRGAPEEILKLCLKKTIPKDVEKFLQEEGEKGHRVLALAIRNCSMSKSNLDLEEKNLDFVGCISFYDPLKESAFDAIKKAKEMKLQVKVLTGDSKEVAGAVAVQVGLISDQSQVMTGEELFALPEGQRLEAATKYSIFARVSPQQKYDIIQLLEQKYEVGFMGEGINDAPALKIANMGMVVHNASDVAREAADIILLNKSLSVIIDGIEEGRRIFGNNVKYLKATMASNFGNFYAVVAASFLAGFLPMLPVQILLLNLLSDFPMMGIATDTVDKNEVDHPRQYDIKDITLVCLLLGFVSTVFDFMFFGLFYQYGPETLRTNWFVASILTELLFLFSIRSQKPIFQSSRPSRFVVIFSVLAAIVTVIIPFTSFGQNVFHFVPPSATHLAWIGGLLILYLICTEMMKLYYYRKFRSQY